METIKAIRSYEELLDTLRENNVPHKQDPTTQTIQLQTAADHLGNLLIVRWEKTLPFVQIIQPMIQRVPADRVQAIEAAIGRLNNIATVPGLEYDYEGGFIYYRLVAPILVDGVRSDLLQAYLHGAVVNATELLGPMRKVVEGTPGEQVLEVALGKGGS